MSSVGSALRLATHIAPGMAGKVAWSLFCTPYPLATAKPHHKDLLDQAESHQVEFGDGVLNAYRWPGPGPKVLLAHGWGARAFMFAEMIEVFRTAGLDVHAFDAPGHERLGQRTNLLEYSSAVRKVARELGPVNALVGHSFGGMACAHASQFMPELERLILIGVPNRLDWLLGVAQRKLNCPEPAMDYIHRRIEKLSGLPVAQHTTAGYLKNRAAQALVIHDLDDREVPYSTAEEMAIEAGARFFPTRGLGNRRILKSVEVAGKIASFVNS